MNENILYTHKHTHTHSHTHTHTQTRTRTYTHINTHTRILNFYMHTYINACCHTSVSASIHSQHLQSLLPQPPIHTIANAIHQQYIRQQKTHSSFTSHHIFTTHTVCYHSFVNSFHLLPNPYSVTHLIFTHPIYIIYIKNTYIHTIML